MARWDFRGYNKKDLPAMTKLDDVCFEPPFRFSPALMRTLAEGEDAIVIVATEDGKLVGFAIADIEQDDEAKIGYVMTIDVAPEVRRNGAARELLWRIEKEVRERGAEEVLLHVWVKNRPAILLYASSGYRQVLREKDFYNEGLDAFLFAKRLK